MSEKRTNREILIPDDIWKAVTKHAALEGMSENGRVSRSEWIRRAIRERIKKQETAVARATRAWKSAVGE